MYNYDNNDNGAKRLLFNDNNNRKRGRPIKKLEQHVLQNSKLTADEFYRRAMRKNTDMVGNRRNRSMSTLGVKEEEVVSK